MDELADPTWHAEYERLVEDPRRYRFLDAAQLVKHYLGLRRRFHDRPVTLAYLYWEPVNATDLALCAIHAAEVAEFTQRVHDRRVRFVSMSYRQLWEDCPILAADEALWRPLPRPGAAAAIPWSF